MEYAEPGPEARPPQSSDAVLGKKPFPSRSRETTQAQEIA